MSRNRYMYAQLDEQTPTFKVTPGKNCRLFPYLWSQEGADFYATQKMSPEQNPYQCHAMSPVDPGQAYTGLPVNFQYSRVGDPKKCADCVNEEPRGPVEGVSPPLEDVRKITVESFRFF